MSNRSEYLLVDDVPDSSRPDDGEPDFGYSGSADERVDCDPTLVEVLQVVFDIGVGERNVYQALCSRSHSNAGDLAEELDRDYSTVNRTLRTLFQKGLVTRRRRILQSGGHLYQYSARPPEQVRALLLHGFEKWADAARDRIDELGDTESDATERPSTERPMVSQS
ncbi:MAG: helix-turn-helix domain-containing protein [Haloarculaceae archaeon]